MRKLNGREIINANQGRGFAPSLDRAALRARFARD